MTTQPAFRYYVVQDPTLKTGFPFAPVAPNEALAQSFRAAVGELATGEDDDGQGEVVATRSVTHDLKRDCEETLRKLNKKTNKVLDELAEELIGGGTAEGANSSSKS